MSTHILNISGNGDVDASLFQCSAPLSVWKAFLRSNLNCLVQFQGNFFFSLVPWKKRPAATWLQPPFWQWWRGRRFPLNLSFPQFPQLPLTDLLPRASHHSLFTWFLWWLAPDWKLGLWPSVTLFYWAAHWVPSLPSQVSLHGFKQGRFKDLFY